MSAAPKWNRGITDPYQRTVARFMDKVQRREDTDCWLWGAATDKDGYGTFQYAGPEGNGIREKRRASRVSFELFKDNIHDEMLVCHKCDTPSCVNPEHLFLGSTNDNVSDRVRKRRSSVGVNHGRSTKPDAFVKSNIERRSLVPFRGRIMSLEDISAETGVPLIPLRGRIDRGWTAEKAVTTPPSNRGQGAIWVPIALLNDNDNFHKETL